MDQNPSSSSSSFFGSPFFFSGVSFFFTACSFFFLGALGALIFFSLGFFSVDTESLSSAASVGPFTLVESLGFFLKRFFRLLKKPTFSADFPSAASPSLFFFLSSIAARTSGITSTFRKYHM